MANKALRLFLPVLLFLSGVASADITPHLLSRIEELSLGIRSYKANYDLILRLEDKELRIKGMLLYKWPRKMRNEMTVEGPLGAGQVIYWK